MAQYLLLSPMPKHLVKGSAARSGCRTHADMRLCSECSTASRSYLSRTFQHAYKSYDPPCLIATTCISTALRPTPLTQLLFLSRTINLVVPGGPKRLRLKATMLVYIVAGEVKSLRLDARRQGQNHATYSYWGILSVLLLYW